MKDINFSPIILKVVCVDNKRLKNKLTIGKEYSVEAIHDGIYKEGKHQNCYCIFCDDGVGRSYPTYRFKLSDKDPQLLKDKSNLEKAYSFIKRKSQGSYFETLIKIEKYLKELGIDADMKEYFTSPREVVFGKSIIEIILVKEASSYIDWLEVRLGKKGGVAF